MCEYTSKIKMLDELNVAYDLATTNREKEIIAVQVRELEFSIAADDSNIIVPGPNQRIY